MKRSELANQICKAIGYRRRVPNQVQLSKPELRAILDYLHRINEHGERPQTKTKKV